MTIEFLNGHGNVVQALSCIEFGAKCVTVSGMVGMLWHYMQMEGFSGYRFRNGNVRSSAIMVF